MIDNTPYQPTYTVFVYGGKTHDYSNITDLDKDWDLFGYGTTTTIGKDFNPTCKRCGVVHHNRVNDKCTHTVRSFIDGEYYNIQTVSPKHELTFDIVVKDDFGTAYDFNALHQLFEGEKQPRYRDFSIHAFWRRDDVEEFKKQYKHLYARYGNKIINHCRSIHTLNERKQYEKCQVDEYSPSIRAKRSVNNIPNSWDDITVSKWHNYKSWKTQKVRKQWMVNDKSL